MRGVQGGALRSRDFRLFFGGALVSSIGTWMQNVTVPYVLLQLTHRGLWVGLAVVAQILPSVVLSPLAGSVADRFDRRVVLLVSQCVQAVTALALWVVWVGHLRSPTLMLVLVGLGGIAAMGTQPAWQAFVTDLVPSEDLLNAVTLNSAQANGARAIGPALGGVVIGVFGAGLAFLLNAVSFVAVVVALLLMRRPPVLKSRPEGRVLAQFKEAIRYARGRPGILLAYVVTAVVCGLGYPAFQLASVFTRRVYHVGPGLYGVLTGSFGVGALIGAGVLAMASRRSSRSDVVRVAVALLGLALVGLGVSRSVSEGAVLLAVMGACSLVAIAAVNTAIQVQVPEYLRGRVLALWVVSYTLSYPVGSLVQGWAADHAGPGPTVFVAGLLVCAVASVFVVRPFTARSLDEDLAPARPESVLIPDGALAAPPFQDPS